MKWRVLFNVIVIERSYMVRATVSDDVQTLFQHVCLSRLPILSAGLPACLHKVPGALHFSRGMHL